MAESDEARWRKALEKLDPETVRAKLDPDVTGVGPVAEVKGIVDRTPHPSRAFVEHWLAEKERRITLMQWVILVASVIAATTGLIAIFKS